MYIPGDVVKLKSGGPSMTVYEGDVDGLDDLVGCVWFNPKDDNIHKSKVYTTKFNKYALTRTKIDEPKSAI